MSSLSATFVLMTNRERSLISPKFTPLLLKIKPFKIDLDFSLEKRYNPV